MSNEEDTSECKMDVDKTAGEVVPRGMPKSGRWWKEVRQQRASTISRVKPLKSSWERKMQLKASMNNTKKLQCEIREKIAAKKAAKIEARKEQEKRRVENARKAEIVQVIKNTNKLKRAKKKLLRTIEKRDINKLNASNIVN